MERSLVIIKPDGAVRRNIGASVIKVLLDRGYRVRAFKEMMVPEQLAKAHYAVHDGKPFFPWLVQFITSARVVVLVLEGDGVIQGVRDALGATFVQKAAPDSLRGRYGLWAGINIAHASDAPETATNEIQLWFQSGGVKESADAEKQAREYVAKYTRRKKDYTADIRMLIESAIKDHDTSDKVRTALEKFLSKDASGVERDEIRALAEAIMASIREEIGRSGK
jgi:nucleoside-diphosphate kinase